jgi:hypothetical protein
MFREIRRSTLALAALGAFEAGSAHAIGFTQGDWTLDVNGTVNAFYTQGKQRDTLGGVTTTTDRANVQNGLLPGWINFVATAKQKGLDVKAHFGFAPGINSNSQIVGLPSGADGRFNDAYSKVDSRNVYFQFGNNSMGTFKFGRDIGLFMSNPILLDMTLLGVGGTVRAAEPFNTTFGMIGHGYMYTGFQPQITYSTPNFGGFAASLGVFNPSQFDPVAGTEKKTPQFQGLASFDWKGNFNGKVWGAFTDQKTSGTGGRKASGFEGGVKLGLGMALQPELLLSGFTAKGLGISTIGAQFLGGSDANGNRLKSSGYFTQFTIRPITDLKLGVSYGENKDKELRAAGLDGKRKAYAFGAYYSLTPSVTLVAEYINEKANNILGADTQKADSFSLGAILFF